MRKKSAKLIIWGGTGNFRVLCELLGDDFGIVGYFDNNPQVAETYNGIPCLGDSQAFEAWADRQEDLHDIHFIVSIGPGKGAARLQVHDRLRSRGLQPMVAIHRTAFVASNAFIGEGSQVYALAAVCADAQIGKACIINTAASVDHECILAEGVSIGPGARLAGLVTVERNADIYTGAVILPRLRIGEAAVVGAGAVVLKDVPPGAVVAGNPARVIKMRNAT